jgi:hypothetical protein
VSFPADDSLLIGQPEVSPASTRSATWTVVRADAPGPERPF